MPLLPYQKRLYFFFLFLGCPLRLFVRSLVEIVHCVRPRPRLQQQQQQEVQQQQQPQLQHAVTPKQLAFCCQQPFCKAAVVLP